MKEGVYPVLTYDGYGEGIAVKRGQEEEGEDRPSPEVDPEHHEERHERNGSSLRKANQG